MSAELFYFGGGNISIMKSHDEILFALGDTARELGYARPQDAISCHVHET